MKKKQIQNSGQDESFIKTLEQVVIGFSDNMVAIRYLFTTLDPMLQEIKKQEALVGDIAQKKGKVLENRFIVEKEKLTSEEENLVKQLILKARGFSRRFPLIRQSSFLLLISYLECLFKDIFKLHYYTHWAAMDNKECKISISDINTAMNLEELKFFVVENYVDTIIYENFKEQINKIFSLLGLNKKRIPINIDILNEADKRRNLLIHNEGKVNQKYIRESGKKVKIGTKLDISADYFNQIYYEIYLLGLILLSYLSVQMKGHEAYSWIINEDVYSLLKRGKFDQVIRFYEICQKIQFIESSDDIVLTVDYLLALKFSGKIIEFEKKLKSIRTLHMEGIYKIAFIVLKNDKKGFLKYFPKTDISLEDWESWPLFSDFRKDQKLFKRIEKRLIQNQKKKDKKKQKIQNDRE